MRLHSQWMLKQTARQEKPHIVEVTQVIRNPAKYNTTQETVLFTYNKRPYSQDMKSFKASYEEVQ